MSKMFDFITGKRSGKVAELEATIEHMGGYLGLEIEDNARLRAALESIANNTCCDGCQEAAKVARSALQPYRLSATAIGQSRMDAEETK